MTPPKEYCYRRAGYSSPPAPRTVWLQTHMHGHIPTPGRIPHAWPHPHARLACGLLRVTSTCPLRCKASTLLGETLRASS